MLQRTSFLDNIKFLFTVTPIVAILGPRQCSKTTLAKQYAKQYSVRTPIHVFDLEDSFDIERLNNPKKEQN